MDARSTGKSGKKWKIDFDFKNFDKYSSHLRFELKGIILG